MTTYPIELVGGPLDGQLEVRPSLGDAIYASLVSLPDSPSGLYSQERQAVYRARLKNGQYVYRDGSILFDFLGSFR